MFSYYLVEALVQGWSLSSLKKKLINTIRSKQQYIDIHDDAQAGRKSKKKLNLMKSFLTNLYHQKHEYLWEVEPGPEDFYQLLQTGKGWHLLTTFHATAG